MGQVESTTKIMNGYNMMFIGFAKLVLGLISLIPTATLLLINFDARADVGIGNALWTLYWIIYAWNAIYLMRLVRGARHLSIALDFTYVFFYWRAFVAVGISLESLSFKSLSGLLPVCFIVYLLIPRVKAQFK